MNFSVISNNVDVKAEADRIAEQNVAHGWRLIDRRLQALRKRGEIMFDSKLGWSIE